MTEQPLTAAEVADLLAVPESWVREATRQDRLPHLHIGRYIRYHPTAIHHWIDQRAAGLGSSPIRSTRRR